MLCSLQEADEKRWKVVKDGGDKKARGGWQERRRGFLFVFFVDEPDVLNGYIPSRVRVAVVHHHEAFPVVVDGFDGDPVFAIVREVIVIFTIEGDNHPLSDAESGQRAYTAVEIVRIGSKEGEKGGNTSERCETCRRHE